jgi:hypothetical protein
MITDTIIYILSFLLRVMTHILIFITQGWSLWPASIIDGMNYFFQHLMTFNIVLPIDLWLQAISFLIKFIVIYVPVKLLMKVVNFFRGSGPIDM